MIARPPTYIPSKMKWATAKTVTSLKINPAITRQETAHAEFPNISNSSNDIGLRFRTASENE